MIITTIAAGQRSGNHVVAPGVVVTVSPAVGASAFVEYTNDTIQDIQNNVAKWKAWPNGTVSAQSVALCNKRGFVRVTALSGAVVLDTNFAPTNDQLAPYATDWGGGLSLSGGGVGVKSAGIIAMSAAPVSVTGTLSSTALAAIAVPALAMGNNGALRVTTLWTFTNNANTKTPGITFGGASFFSLPVTTTTSTQTMTMIRNRNAANSQVGYGATASSGPFGGPGTGTPVTTAAVDTTQAQTLNIIGTLANVAEATQQQPSSQADVLKAAEQILKQRDFDSACNKIFDAGKAEFAGDWDSSLRTFQMLGGATPEFLEAVTAMDAGHKVLHHLGQNPETAERLLSLPPLRMALELARLETTVGQAKPKPVSNAPAPINPIGGRSSPVEPEEFASAAEQIAWWKKHGSK